MEKNKLNIDIKKEQEKALEKIKEQGERILVCTSTGCSANGSLEIIKKLRELGANVSALTKEAKMTAVPTGCIGFCEEGVLVVIPDKHLTYVKVKPSDVDDIFESLKNNTIVE